MALPLSGLLVGRAHLPLDQPPSWRPLQRRSTRSHISGDLELELSWRPLIGNSAQAAAAADTAADAAAIASPAPPPHPADTAGIPAPVRAHVSAVSATAAAPRPGDSSWDTFAPERSPPAARPTPEPAWAAGWTAPPVALEFSSCVAQSAPWEAAATAADDKDFWAQFEERDGPSASATFGGAADVPSAARPGVASLGGGGSSSLWDDLASLEPGAASTSTSPDLDLGLDLGLDLDLDRDLGLGLASLEPAPPAGATPGGVAGAADAGPVPRDRGGRREAREARRRKVMSDGEPDLMAGEPSAEASPPAAAGTFWDNYGK